MKKKEGLSERQLHTIDVWIANPLDSLENVAKKAGINVRTLYTYRKNPDFMRVYHEKCRLQFDSLEAKAMKVLDSQLENGNLNAAKYVLDSLGYKPTDKIEASVSQDVVISIGE